ncbi:hypothetical protein A5693_18815 [Mycobacterium sp. E1319]|nr:hypothetical protein A5693_18815 [Mycobacterium sp. E1319]
MATPMPADGEPRAPGSAAAGGAPPGARTPARFSRSARPGAHRLTGGMWIGWLEFDLLLGDVHSLKQKRSVVRPVVAELRRKFSVAAAETGSRELYRRAGIGKVKFALLACAVWTTMVAFTSAGFLSDHPTSFAVNVMGR